MNVTDVRGVKIDQKGVDAVMARLKDPHRPFTNKDLVKVAIENGIPKEVEVKGVMMGIASVVVNRILRNEARNLKNLKGTSMVYVGS